MRPFTEAHSLTGVVDPVEDQRVEVDVQVERPAETLHERDRSTEWIVD